MIIHLIVLLKVLVLKLSRSFAGVPLEKREGGGVGGWWWHSSPGCLMPSTYVKQAMVYLCSY